MRRPYKESKVGHISKEIGYIQLLLDKQEQPLPVYSNVTTGRISFKGSYQSLAHRGDYKVVRFCRKEREKEYLSVFRYVNGNAGERVVKLEDAEANLIIERLKQSTGWFFELDIYTEGPVFLPSDKVPFISFNSRSKEEKNFIAN